jgi:hypothetical protein
MRLSQEGGDDDDGKDTPRPLKESYLNLARWNGNWSQKREG